MLKIICYKLTRMIVPVNIIRNRSIGGGSPCYPTSSANCCAYSTTIPERAGVCRLSISWRLERGRHQRPYIKRCNRSSTKDLLNGRQITIATSKSSRHGKIITRQRRANPGRQRSIGIEGIKKEQEERPRCSCQFSLI